MCSPCCYRKNNYTCERGKGDSPLGREGPLGGDRKGEVIQRMEGGPSWGEQEGGTPSRGEGALLRGKGRGLFRGGGGGS